MGFVHLTVRVANPADLDRAIDLDLLVDSGALYSMVPAPLLEQLGIQPTVVETFDLADGSSIERRVGVAIFTYRGRPSGSNVIFGEPGDSSLLGIITLEGLGLVLDPVKGELKPIQFRLGHVAPAA